MGVPSGVERFLLGSSGLRPAMLFDIIQGQDSPLSKMSVELRLSNPGVGPHPFITGM